MNRILKSLKRPKHLKRIVAILLIFGMFVSAGLAYATSEDIETSDAYDRNEIIERLGIANNFAVFAKNFNNNNHMEGSIAVENLLGASSNLGNSDSVYTYTNQKEFNITISKSLEGEITSEQTFTIGAYQKNPDGSYTLIKTVNVTTDLTGQGSANMDTTGMLPGTEYYFFEIGDNGPITGSTGVINGQDYQVTVSSTSGSNTIVTPTTGVGNTSYIENFYNGNESIELFQSNNSEKATVVIGQNNQYSSDNNNQNVVTGVDGLNYKLGPNVNVNQVTGEFPIDFDNELKNLADFSAELATAVSSNNVKVVNIQLTADGTGIDYTKITTDGNPVISENGQLIDDNNDWNNNGLTTDGKFLVINVDCTNAKNNGNSFTVQGCPIDGNSPMGWNKIANSVLWNFYTTDGNSYSSFDGSIGYNGGLGTLLAPNATISCTQSTNGAVISNTASHPNCEIHHIKLIEIITTEQTNFNVSVTNVPSNNTGSLNIKKNVTLNSVQATSSTAQLVNGTYTFDIYDATGTNLIKEGINVPVTNGVSGETQVSGLEPGDYIVKERTNSLPAGMSLVGNNEVKVTVVANETTNIPTAEFTNNRDVGSFTITKKVTLNDVPTSSIENTNFEFSITQDGNAITGFNFDLENKTYVYVGQGGQFTNPIITINGNQEAAVTVTGLPAGNYTIAEVNVPENMQVTAITGGNVLENLAGTTIAVEAGQTAQVQAISFTNNKTETGSLEITKNVLVNNSATNTTLADGTYSFKIMQGNNELNYYRVSEDDSGTVYEYVGTAEEDLVKDLSLTIENGVSKTVRVTNLPVGNYAVVEDLTNLPDNVMLKSVTGGIGNYQVKDNDTVSMQGQTVNISSNQTPEIIFNNNINVGSLKITKAVLGNGESSLGYIADGTYEFTIKNSAGEVIKLSYDESTKQYLYDTNGSFDKVAIKIENGASASQEIINLPEDTYTISEVDSSLLYSIQIDSNEEDLDAKNAKVTIDADNLSHSITFTNNKKIEVGYLTIKKNVSLNGNATDSIKNTTFTFNINKLNDSGEIDPSFETIVKTILIDGETTNSIKDISLEVGKYRITEVGVGDDVIVNDGTTNYVDVEITANDTVESQITATFTNYYSEGELEITKNVTVNGQNTGALSNQTFKFEVSGPDGYQKTVSVKVAKGETSNSVKLTGLKPGTYTVTEIDNGGLELVNVSSSGSVENNVATVVIDKNTSGSIQVATASFTNNQDVGSLKITKNVTVNGNATETNLADGTYKFKVTGPSGYEKEVSIEITDGKENSKTLTNLEPGEYKIEEIDIPKGMELVVNEGDSAAKTIQVTGGNEASVALVSFTNNKTVKGSLEITKKVTINGEDAAGSNLVDGIYKFNVAGPDGFNQIYEIEIKDGKAVNNIKLDDLTLGTYTIFEDTEGLASKNITVSEGSAGIEIKLNLNNYDQEHLASFTNDLTVEDTILTLHKAIGEDNQYPDADTKEYQFEIITDANVAGMTFVSTSGNKQITFTGNKALININANETISFAGLPEGHYIVREINGNVDGYELDTSYIDNSGDNHTNGNVALEPGVEKIVTVTNTYKQTSLTIKKDIDENTNQYEEAVNMNYSFKITNNEIPDGSSFIASDGVTTIIFNNGEAQLVIKGENEVTFNGLPTGNYQVEEINGEVANYNLTTDYQDTSGDKDDQIIDLTVDQVEMITITNSYEYVGQNGSMSITKVLKDYNQTFKGGTFVFEVTGTKVNSAGENVEIYHGMIGVVANSSGKFTANTLTDLPIETGVTYTVTEVYSGSAYRPVQSEVVIALNTLEDISKYQTSTGDIILTAEFENIYDGTTTGGSGVINVYGFESVTQIFE
ncbi:hypothetical protein [uncultured Thomasclavelia sp.]|uniref:beta strand repeat-containing protein n=1 Tax=uncultured Thomasclavelia sp. TaxID=3025759 RepID=UPI0025EA4333|nr:hypothetical protein [uncultured Thomasclavelia sp.]